MRSQSISIQSVPRRKSEALQNNKRMRELIMKKMFDGDKELEFCHQIGEARMLIRIMLALNDIRLETIGDNELYSQKMK